MPHPHFHVNPNVGWAFRLINLLVAFVRINPARPGIRFALIIRRRQADLAGFKRIDVIFRARISRGREVVDARRVLNHLDILFPGNVHVSAGRIHLGRRRPLAFQIADTDEMPRQVGIILCFIVGFLDPRWHKCIPKITGGHNTNTGIGIHRFGETLCQHLISKSHQDQDRQEKYDFDCFHIQILLFRFNSLSSLRLLQAAVDYFSRVPHQGQDHLK